MRRPDPILAACVSVSVLYVVFALALLSAAPASAAPYNDPAWRSAPAWTVTIPAGATRTIPAGVCPFGISDLAAYRGSARLDRYVAFGWTGQRAIQSAYRRTVRAYVWCG